MAYLVTGGTGYIGSYVVCDLLAAGKEVVCLQRSGVTPLFRELVGEDGIKKVKLIQGDVSMSCNCSTSLNRMIFRWLSTWVT